MHKRQRYEKQTDRRQKNNRYLCLHKCYLPITAKRES